MESRRIKLFKPIIDDDEISKVIEVLRSGWLAHGPVVEEFEKMFAEYVGVNHAAAVSNGTVALTLLLKAYGIGPGDKVLVPDYTFIATATSVLMVGARPVFVDIDEKTFNIDPEDLLNKIDSSCRAVIAVHLFGHPADMRALREIAQDHNLVLIEDAAQAHGAEAYGKKVGSLGDAAAFSFYATKNMTTGGEGGIVVSDDRRIIEKVKLLRNHGQVSKYIHAYLGGNFRMTSIQAAIGIAQLRKLDRLNSIRRRNAEEYRRLLQGLESVELPVEMPWAKHVYHLYAIKLAPEIRDCVKECMLSNSIEVAIHYPIPLHEQPLFKKLGLDADSRCSKAEIVSRRELSLPVHPGLSAEDIAFIASTLRRCIERCLEQQ